MIIVAPNVEQVSALSIMGLPMHGASTGTMLRIRAEDADAEAAADTLANLVENGFENEDFPGN